MKPSFQFVYLSSSRNSSARNFLCRPPEDWLDCVSFWKYWSWKLGLHVKCQYSFLEGGPLALNRHFVWNFNLLERRRKKKKLNSFELFEQRERVRSLPAPDTRTAHHGPRGQNVLLWDTRDCVCVCARYMFKYTSAALQRKQEVHNLGPSAKAEMRCVTRNYSVILLMHLNDKPRWNNDTWMHRSGVCSVFSHLCAYVCVY